MSCKEGPVVSFFFFFLLVSCDCCGGAGVAKTSFCGLLHCFLSPVVVALGPGLLVVLAAVGTGVGGPL